MTKPHNVKLAVICESKKAEPYREEPSDISYKGPRELAVCYWCRFRVPFKFDIEMGGCAHPKQVHLNPEGWMENLFSPGRRDLWNRDGPCTRFRLNRWTRFLRLFGLRAKIVE